MAGEPTPILKHASFERTVMVVDDEPSVRRMLNHILSANGYECHVEDGAVAALDALPTVRPSVVISDVNMPGRDGLWLLKEITSGFGTPPSSC